MLEGHRRVPVRRRLRPKHQAAAARLSEDEEPRPYRGQLLAGQRGVRWAHPRDVPDAPGIPCGDRVRGSSRLGRTRHLSDACPEDSRGVATDPRGDSADGGHLRKGRADPQTGNHRTRGERFRRGADPGRPPRTSLGGHDLSGGVHGAGTQPVPTTARPAGRWSRDILSTWTSASSTRTTVPTSSGPYYVLRDEEVSAPAEVQRGVRHESCGRLPRREGRSVRVSREESVDRVARELITKAGYAEFPHALGHPSGPIRP